MNDTSYQTPLAHGYDGIQEYDNPLPGWWKWLFILSCLFSAAYVSYYHIGIGPSVEDKYQAEVAHHVEKLLAQLGDVQPDNATILKFMQEDDWMAAISGLFVGNCAQCHAPDGGGNIGPNLTDERYKNVREPADIFNVVTDGIAGSGMTGWKERMSEPQRILISAYVASLRGTTPGSPKAAEGNVAPAWSTFADEEAAGADTDATESE